MHEYGHAFEFFKDKNNSNFNGRNYLISSLANGTKITNEAYQKFMVLLEVHMEDNHQIMNYLPKLLDAASLFLNKIEILVERS